MPTDNWTDTLSCPSCGAGFGIVVLRDVAVLDTYRHGERIPGGATWPGEAECRHCGVTFEFMYQDE